MATDAFSTIAERLLPGGRVRVARRLTGGVSAEVHALELEGAEGLRTVVVRRHGDAAWRDSVHGQVAAKEYDLLQTLHGEGLPVPEPLLLDTSGSVLPTPFLVTAFVEGSTEVSADGLDACVDAMAEMLVRVHTLPTRNLPDLPPRVDPLPELFDHLPGLPVWQTLREHLEQRPDTAYQGKPALLHGDYWPGNLIWQHSRLVGVLDWEDAALGDPLSDVASCRIELLWKYGSAAMERFTESYVRHLPCDLGRLALWEVYVASAAIRFMGAWGLDPDREGEMRSKAVAFVRRAADALLRA